MLAVARRSKIKEVLQEKKSVTVSDMAHLFDVTEETIRRDLKELEGNGFLTRTHGGAFIQDGVQNDVQFSLRESVYIDSKIAIAKQCAQFIEHGDSIFLDPSTTALAICDQIKDKRLTVLTNSIKAANILKDMLSIKLIMVGGYFDASSMSFLGRSAVDFVKNYYVDKAFVSCRSLSLENGVTDSSEVISSLRTVIIDRSEKVYLIADYSKFDRSSFVKICDYKDIDYIVTDKPLDSRWQEEMKKYNVQIFDSSASGMAHDQYFLDDQIG